MNGEPLPLECRGDEVRPKKSCKSGCGLKAPIRPRFSTGQQLHAEDLGDLSGWVDDHLRLQRYRGGWGAVCGLGVTVQNRDADAYPTLIVHPGYAVSPCGTDVVVPKPLPICLKETCRAFLDPCGPAGREDSGGVILGQDIPANQALWLDLYLAPRIRPTQYRPVPPRPGSPRGGYEPSREKDTGELQVERVGKQSDPPPEQHHIAAEHPFEVARRAFVEKLGKGVERIGAARKSWMLDLLASVDEKLRSDPALIGGVHLQPAMIKTLPNAVFDKSVVGDDEAGMKIKAQRVGLFALLYLGWLAHAPFACPPACRDRVRLARVLLWVQDKERPYCRAVFVDPHPPYRRLHGPADIPAGTIDLRSYHGAWYESEPDFPPLTDQLKVRKEPLTPADPAALIAGLEPPSLTFVSPSWPVQAHVLEVQGLGNRIVRFGKQAEGSA